MAVLGFAGAEIGSTAELSNLAGTVTADSAVRYTGIYSFKFAPGGEGALTFADQSTTAVYFRGYFRMPALPSSDSAILRWTNSGGGVMGTLSVTSGGLLKITGGATVTGATVLVVNEWHRIEVRVKQAPTGQVDVRIGGRSELAHSAFAMANPIARFLMGWTTGVGNFGYWDDVHIQTDGWIGAGYVIARQGDAVGTYTGFTVTGANIQTAWSETPFNAASFAASTASAQTQTMKCEAFSRPPRGAFYGVQSIRPHDSILGARVLAVAKRGSGTPDHYLTRVIGGLAVNEVIATTTSDALYRGSVFTPTLAELDEAEIGGARVAGSANLTIEDAWLMVSVAGGRHGMLSFTGFESGSLSEAGFTSGAATADTVTKRTGRYAAKFDGVGSLMQFPIFNGQIGHVDTERLFVRMYVLMPALPASNESILTVWASPGIQVSLYVQPTGDAFIDVRGTPRGTLVGAIKAGTWHRVELGVLSKIGDVDGSVTLKVDQQEVTYVGDTGPAYRTMLVGIHIGAASVLYVDDVAVHDRNWVGPGRVLARQGTSGSPTNTNWTKVPSGGINSVWSDTPVNTGTYAEPSGVDRNQTMLVAPVSVAGANGELVRAIDGIQACRLLASVQLQSAGSTGVNALRRRVNGVVTDDQIPISSTSPAYFTGEIFTALRETLDAMEMGGAQGAGTLMRIHDLWLMVAYAELEGPVHAAPSEAQMGVLLELRL